MMLMNISKYIINKIKQWHLNSDQPTLTEDLEESISI